MKKLLAIFIAFVTLFCVTGCGLFNKDNEKDKKYDVTIKVTSNYGGEWIFTPDIKELHVEIPYDGLERRFYVDCYQLKDHPRWSNEWLTPKEEGNNIFAKVLLYRTSGGKYRAVDISVKEIGEYCYNFSACATSDLWNYRSVLLYIAIR